MNRKRHYQEAQHAQRHHPFFFSSYHARDAADGGMRPEILKPNPLAGIECLAGLRAFERPTIGKDVLVRHVALRRVVRAVRQARVENRSHNLPAVQFVQIVETAPAHGNQSEQQTKRAEQKQPGAFVCRRAFRASIFCEPPAPANGTP